MEQGGPNPTVDNLWENVDASVDDKEVVMPSHGPSSESNDVPQGENIGATSSTWDMRGEDKQLKKSSKSWVDIAK